MESEHDERTASKRCAASSFCNSLEISVDDFPNSHNRIAETQATISRAVKSMYDLQHNMLENVKSLQDETTQQMQEKDTTLQTLIKTLRRIEEESITKQLRIETLELMLLRSTEKLEESTNIVESLRKQIEESLQALERSEKDMVSLKTEQEGSRTEFSKQLTAKDEWISTLELEVASLESQVSVKVVVLEENKKVMVDLQGKLEFLNLEMESEQRKHRAEVLALQAKLAVVNREEDDSAASGTPLLLEKEQQWNVEKKVLLAQQETSDDKVMVDVHIDVKERYVNMGRDSLQDTFALNELQLQNANNRLDSYQSSQSQTVGILQGELLKAKGDVSEGQLQLISLRQLVQQKNWALDRLSDELITLRIEKRDPKLEQLLREVAERKIQDEKRTELFHEVQRELLIKIESLKKTVRDLQVEDFDRAVQKKEDDWLRTVEETAGRVRQEGQIKIDLLKTTIKEKEAEVEGLGREWSVKFMSIQNNVEERVRQEEHLKTDMLEKAIEEKISELEELRRQDKARIASLEQEVFHRDREIEALELELDAAGQSNRRLEEKLVQREMQEEEEEEETLHSEMERVVVLTPGESTVDVDALKALREELASKDQALQGITKELEIKRGELDHLRVRLGKLQQMEAVREEPLNRVQMELCDSMGRQIVDMSGDVVLKQADLQARVNLLESLMFEKSALEKALLENNEVIRGLREQLDSYKRLLERKEQHLSAAVEEKRGLERRMSASALEGIGGSENDLKVLQRRIKQKEEEIGQLRREKDQEKRAMESQMSAMCKAFSEEKNRFLVSRSPESPTSPVFERKVRSPLLEKKVLQNPKKTEVEEERSRDIRMVGGEKKGSTRSVNEQRFSEETKKTFDERNSHGRMLGEKERDLSDHKNEQLSGHTERLSSSNRSMPCGKRTRIS
mmetsp:Transcript_6876/g.10792  ORF Transcript_6876/g.10792 Transcript_6876/m.10792 type:complete len:914 (-) Transcript_6876:79-2820(-)